MSISGSVGVGGRNQYGDVKTVQQLLQRNGYPQLRADGRMGPKTIEAIKQFQSRFMSRPDGVVDIHGKTWNTLSNPSGSNTINLPSTPSENINNNSGRLTVSAGQVTFDAEGNDNPHSPFFSRHIHWPGGKSGVTIGRGYDMGGRSSDEVYLDLIRVGVEEQQARALSLGATKKETSAQLWVRRNKIECGVITRESQARLFETIYPIYVSRARSVYLSATAEKAERTSWDELKPAIKDIVVDLVYQGAGFKLNMQAAMYNDIDKLADFIDSSSFLQQYEKGRNRARYLRSRK
ncbi:peptidoglycan-binding protein [Pantoea agglomerans]|nr:peptidoglycan-binding protein [Pantoea agglomerans]WIL40650.1 peptidoglycan-binding protein [Pantoea agglomerans]